MSIFEARLSARGSKRNREVVRKTTEEEKILKIILKCLYFLKKSCTFAPSNVRHYKNNLIIIINSIIKQLTFNYYLL